MGERCLSRIVRRMGIHQMKPKEKRVVANCCEPYARMLDEDVCCGISPQSIDRPGHRSDALTIAKIEFVIQKAQRPQTAASFAECDSVGSPNWASSCFGTEVALFRCPKNPGTDRILAGTRNATRCMDLPQ